MRTKPESARGGHLGPTKDAHKQHRPRTTDETLDEAVDESFPASDPPARTEPTTHIGGKKDKPSAELSSVRTEQKLDEALALTFPASDPPAQTQPIVHIGRKATNGGRGAPQR